MTKPSALRSSARPPLVPPRNPDWSRAPRQKSREAFALRSLMAHNGVSAAVFTKDHLFDHVMSAIPHGIGRDEWLQELLGLLVAGFVKTDIDFQRRGEVSGTT
ncbi:uncharacterized protein A4U43_C07F13400 [Asparagus officinalis]|uniref:Uncharacterized protein n=1 Tax=Asparagus officinalis TaxID=4686 RepID=A0A5P1EBM9_ASPOF|nr:uncharacterized protein A4U43_C07F13400 [Asparagus officinalis]